MTTPDPALMALAGRRLHIERIFSVADRMARRMGGRFVTEPRKLRQYVRALKAKEPPMSDDLLKLAERCEAASVSDLVALNADILRALGWRSVNGAAFAPGSSHRALQVPYYVGSIDDAMTLIPDGAAEMVQIQRVRRPSKSSGWVRISIKRDDGWTDGDEGRGSTVALATCAAALRVRALREEHDSARSAA